jgi:putative salt-induced outer membrane protein YdiY
MMGWVITARRWASAVRAVLVGLAIGASALSAQQTLVLADGDQLTGALVSVSGGTWVFSYRGQDVGVTAADIASFTAPDPVGFRLSDNSVVAASVATGPGGLILPLADGTTRTVAATDVEAAGDPSDLTALEEVVLGYFSPFGRFWALSTTLGATAKSGNTETGSFNLRFDLDRETAQDRLAFTLLMTEERNQVEEGEGRELTSQKFIGNVRADIFPWTRVFLFGVNRYTRDQFSDIDLRVNLSVGAGYHIVKSDRSDLRAALGLGGRHEDFTSDEPTTTVGTFNVNGGWSQKLGGFVFDTALDYNSALEDFGDYQVLSDTNLTATIVAGLGFRVGLLLEYDNTPTGGSENQDATFTTALNYTLGR